MVRLGNLSTSLGDKAIYPSHAHLVNMPDKMSWVFNIIINNGLIYHFTMFAHIVK